MSRIPDDMFEVHAPDDAVAWAASYGWIRDQLDLEQVRARNDLVIDVGDDRWVRDLIGPAPLAAVVRMDRDLQELIDRLLRFFSGLVDLAEDNEPQ
jgi:hypothetical protein